ncbi:MAG TPA: alpha/beta hydrolase-fold protein [Silvibacterium sp.]|nr:alpha/beta hydrolase-fold protein [Silvibacterium sp.]
MRAYKYFSSSLLTLFLFAACAFAQETRHLFFRVTVGPEITGPVSGRLLIFVSAGEGAKKVDLTEFQPTATFVAAKEIYRLAPGGSVDVDTDGICFPEPFSKMKPGDYQAQAVLDVGHTYAYAGRTEGDWESAVVPLRGWTPGAGSEPVLTLTTVAPGRVLPVGKPDAEAAAHLEEMQSAALTAFWGQPESLKAWVILPPGYDGTGKIHYPTVYWTHGFGGNLASSKLWGERIYERMAAGKMPPMIWVMLDESLPTGTHEFADSVNNGPWGEALTKEFIPYLETKYRMDRRARGRFLQGHSSGGWATLQLQVNYPEVFGGTWSTSPDPSDFHDFTGIDLYAPHANVYHRADGTAYPLVREHGRVIETFEQFAKTERVLGGYGGQIASFEWVFSPRGEDGRPLEMFDRDTGVVDPAVVDYWRDHYDLAHIVKADWAQRGPELRGKIHVFVGTADTFYLDGAARKFDAVLRGLNANAHFTLIPDRTHRDLYRVGDDRAGLFDEIGAEMWAVARGGQTWKGLTSTAH